MPTLQELSAPHRPRSALTAVADAAGLILLLDAALWLLPGHGSTGAVFFHVPVWFPAARVWPAIFGVGILLRFGPLIVAAVALAAWNTFEYSALLAAGRISGLPVCLSAALACALVPALAYRRLARPAAIAAAGGGLLLAHLFTFGATDYRRPAEAIVVFGAKAYSGHQCSELLADRTLTGIRLYKQGYADKLVLSGGGCEPAAMRHLALARGVPGEDIVLDFDGLNTEATLRNLRGSFRRVLAVSNYYHSARIKMTADRFGLSCFTVPARMRRRLPGEPWWVLRECAAYMKYYLTVR